MRAMDVMTSEVITVEQNTSVQTHVTITQRPGLCRIDRIDYRSGGLLGLRQCGGAIKYQNAVDLRIVDQHR